ncbi:cyanophycinase [Anaerosinus massiliensis]|uniref:cyanophycinase n=1 Tax=Massilibacillus massiliensis TaxID=1806837 RepID=UPI000A50A905|nr:cyanophycinase [Massilibacillus massiliensis]
MQSKVEGVLLIIGGNEDKSGECQILRTFIERAGGRDAKIAVMTTATELPEEVGVEYKLVFEWLGAKEVDIIHIADRIQAFDQHLAENFSTYTGIFFTGGDQLRLTSILGGSVIDKAIKETFAKGAVLAGTSAGASVMSHTMIIGGDSSETPKKATISMAEGMGFIDKVVIDQHFAQRGRINRLLAVVAQNPNVIGIGIDEDTAILVEANGKCCVVGSQTVTIVDGRQIVHSNISESSLFDPLAITNVILHILPNGFGYDLRNRKPYVSHK